MPIWHDDEQQQLTAATSASAQSMLELLQNRWVVLIGDSSVRMLFHFLLGALTLGWQKWPSDLREGHGPEQPPTAWLAALRGTPCLDRHEANCMEDAHFEGVHEQLRLTCLWTEFGEVSTLGALEGLADGVVPDAIILGVGAWWVWHRPAESLQYEGVIRSLLAHVERVFAGEGARTTRVFAATTSCGRKEDGGDGTAHVAMRFNAVAKKQVLATDAWSWFDRDVLTGVVCDADSDCAGNQFTSRFHPAGDALSVLIVLLLHHLSQSWNNDRLARVEGPENGV